MEKRVFEFLKNHLDFRFHPLCWISLIITLLIIPAVEYLPTKYAFENGLLESLQLVFLFASLIIGFCAKNNKKFFKFLALVVTILILREINCTRTLFFPIPDIPNGFYSWKEIKYGWLVNPIFGLYIASVGLYFILNKFYLDSINYIKTKKIPFWSVLFLFIGMAIGTFEEKFTGNMIIEEMAEMLFYSSFMNLIWIYGFNKDYELK